jgi:predicted ATPase
VLALLSFFAFPEPDIKRLLEEMLGITGFHSAMVLFRQPWFAKSTRGRAEASDFWGAKGRPGSCARHLRDIAFFPLTTAARQIDDYREKGANEQQFCVYLRNSEALNVFSKNFSGDLEMFEALESVDISDLIRWVQVWVTRKNDLTGDISFGDLSDGERQLLMVLGLIRLSRGKKALFLLDEPDTHLNPAWQHRFLDLIRAWVQADSGHSQFVIATHHPLTIAALNKEEVRVMFTDSANKITAKPPYTDPKGMGFTATLTEIFGLPSSLDPETQRQVDERNVLARIDKRSAQQERKLIEINDKLTRLGFMFEDREPLYQDFLRAWHDVRYADVPLLSPEQIAARQRAMQELVKELVADRDRPH